MIGRSVSHYRIVGQLGAGAMGVVYQAEDEPMFSGMSLQAQYPAMNTITKSGTRRKMRYIELGDTRIETNEHGFVVDPRVWTKELAEHMAQKDGLALTEAHWEVISILR